jgi:hypothetical protein
MFQTAADFVKAQWAALTTDGKTKFLVGVAIGFVVRSFI